MRSLPLVLTLTGLFSWFLFQWSPALSAAVPVGGALMAAGGLYDALWIPWMMAGGVSALSCAVLLTTTSADLNHPARPRTILIALLTSIRQLSTIAALWWVPVLGRYVWALAGREQWANELSPQLSGIVAGGLLVAFASLSHLQQPSQSETPSPPATAQLFWGISGGIALAILGLFLGAPMEGYLGDRVWHGLFPTGLAIVPVIIGQELIFRGWLLQKTSTLTSIAAWTLIVCPTQPVYGIVTGVTLWTIRVNGGLGASGLARLVSLLPLLAA